MQDTHSTLMQHDSLDEAVNLHQQGHLREAEDTYRRILQNDPHHINAALKLSSLYTQQGLRQNALDILDHAIQAGNPHPELFNHKGILLQQLHHHDEALKSYNTALLLNPNFAEALNNRAILLCHLGYFNEALMNLDQAIAVKPDFAEAFNNRGTLLLDLERFDEALSSLSQAIALQSDYPEALNNYGNTLQKLCRFEEALNCYDKAIALNPHYADALNNRGQALKHLKRLEEALTCYNQAIALTPFNAAQILCNRGDTLRNMHRFGEALTSYDQAIAQNPTDAGIRVNKSLCELLLGNYTQGWQNYEWRLHLRSHYTIRHQEYPRWAGNTTDLAGKTILLHTEQGAGDTLQFCRYTQHLAAQGAHVILEVTPALKTLLLSLNNAVHIVQYGEPLPPIDLQCPLMSLPLALGTTLRTIPNSVPYLSADPEHIHVWKNRLGPQTRPRIGLVWSGNPQHIHDADRSIPLEAFKALFTLPLDFYCLQKDIRHNDLETLQQSPIQSLSEHLHDFSDTAAAISQMDIVISVDTAVAHLAGALGKLVWILLPYTPDWRWLLKRNDSPWYPTARLFRQPSNGDWNLPIASMTETLSTLSARNIALQKSLQ